MKAVRLTIILIIGILFQGCMKDLLEEHTILMSSCVINGERFERTWSFRPISGPVSFPSFSFSEGIGHFSLYIYDTEHALDATVIFCIHIIIRCSENEYAPGKRFIIKTPNDDSELLHKAVGFRWDILSEADIPVDRDGIAVAYGINGYSIDDPIGLSGYLEVTDLINGYFHNRYELSCDTIPPITITDGFFIAKQHQ